MHFYVKYLVLLIAVVILAACQGDQEEPSASSNAVKETVAPAAPEKTVTVAPEKKQEPVAELEKRVVKEVRAVEKELKKEVKKGIETTVKETQEGIKEVVPDVDLNVSGKYLEKVHEDDEDYLETPPAIGERKGEKHNKIEVSGNVLIDGKEEKTIKKLDGAEVKVSVPID